MKGTAQVVKGRVKEAAGALAGDDKLRAEGRAEQAVGHVKQAAEKGVRHVKESARKVVDSARSAARKAID